MSAMKKYDLTGVPGDLLLDDNYVNQIYDAIENIQNGEATKKDISEAYKDFCNIVIGEMNEKVEFKNVHMRNDLNKRRKHVKKPYWNDNLNGVHKEFWDLDRRWIKARGSYRRYIQRARAAKRKQLDREIQQAKWKQWRQTQQKILDLESENQKEFWKCIGKVGICIERQNCIPWEIISPDGSTSKDHGEVLERWHSDYSNLLNSTTQHSARDGESNVAYHEQGQQHGLIDTGITLPITHREVQLALNRDKNGKSYGFDGI